MMDFDCPHCSFGMNKEVISEIHEDDAIGEWDITCRNCNKEIKLIAEPSITYWAHAKEEKEEG